MEPARTTGGRLSLVKLFHGFILLCMSTRMGSAALSSTSLGNETDRMALLNFKKSITQDPLHVMSSWNESVHFCGWVGVTCNHYTKRVFMLNLQDQKLTGSLPPSIGNLSYLARINLGSNRFRGEIPEEIGRLQSLHFLNLSYNSFSGKIPTNLSQCTQLKTIEFRYNELIGSIPNQLSSLLKLNHMGFDYNNLTGTIPTWIGNFSSLHHFDLSYNNLRGSIPNELGRLTRLRRFTLQGDNLSGIIPASIYNITSIALFGVMESYRQMLALHFLISKNLSVATTNSQEIFLISKNSQEIFLISKNSVATTNVGITLPNLQKFVWYHCQMLLDYKFFPLLKMVLLEHSMLKILDPYKA